ncbi:MAG: hypothetical protein HY814_03675 [Candidatus Riflebacteria bacterium]|nr:hypothetical protein [Candidatus Riflebacteria bacterium]
MARYITTNIRLAPDRYGDLRRRASREHKSVAQFVREAIDVRLGYGGEAAPPSPEADPFWNVIGLAEGDQTDGAIQHDHYLYGWPKERSGETIRRHRRPRRSR